MISETALQEFKDLYRQEFGEEISDEKATELAINLLTLFDCIYKPVKRAQLDKIIAKEKSENKN